MKNKKGFTLIELLAVILILGIIALIAIPTVNNIITEARRGAFSSTLNNLNKSVEEKCTLQQIKNEEITTSYTITDGVITPSLDIKGDLPDGIITVNTNCEVAFNLADKNFTGNKEFTGEIEITDGSSLVNKYKEELLNGTDPVVSGDLIPVIIESNGTVKKADISSKWYSYENKEWANAVILTDTGKIESDGTILESSIESYFVWIPRYKYKLFDMGEYNGYISGTSPGLDPKEVEIVFENKNTPVSIGAAVGEYHSHPAFQAFNTNGIWVGKFQTTKQDNKTIIKPDCDATNDYNMRTKFDMTYNYKREYNSHMMKNTEWGAVLYLSHSMYGINGEIPDHGEGTYIENNTSTTTGNITGIFEMNDSEAEVVAAYVDGVDLSETGFESDPATMFGSAYFDKYPSDTSDYSYHNRILGDAIGEIGPIYFKNHQSRNNWYGEFALFISPGLPWLVREMWGPFGFSPTHGDSGETFRVVLAK